MSKSSLKNKMNTLNSLIQEIESPDIDIEIAVNKYKKAASLAKEIKSMLNNLENEISQIDITDN